MAETKSSGPVLSLDTLVEHYQVRIRTRADEPNGGTLYDLANPGELGILDYHRIASKGARVQEMMKQQEDLSEAQAEELSLLLDTMCRVILRAPAEVHARLSDPQRMEVLNVFTALQRGTKLEPAGAKDEQERRSTGESSSPV